MATKSKTEQPKRPRRTKLDDELDSKLKRRNKHIVRVAAADAWKAKKQEKFDKKLNKQYRKRAGKSPQKLAHLDSVELPRFLKRAWYWLTQRHGKTIERDAGTVKYVNQSVIKVDVPSNVQPGIKLLLAHPDGMQFLTPNWALNKAALDNAPEEIQELLRPRGFWWGPHMTVSVNSPATGKTKLLGRWRDTRSASAPSEEPDASEVA